MMVKKEVELCDACFALEAKYNCLNCLKKLCQNEIISVYTVLTTGWYHKSCIVGGIKKIEVL